MNLNLMTISELRKLAAQFGIAGRSTMKKAELIRELSDPDIADLVELSITVDEIEETAVVDAATAEHEDEEIDLTSTIDDMISGWLPAAISSVDADVIVPAGMFDPELTYYADGTHVVMRAQGTEQRGIAVGMTTDAGPYQFQAVRFTDGTVKNVAPHVLHRDNTDEQADAEAGELLDAALGEPVETNVKIRVDRYSEGRASVKMIGHRFGDMTREAYRIGRRWELIDQEHGHVFHTVRARSLSKAVKTWAKRLDVRAERIDVARSF